VCYFTCIFMFLCCPCNWPSGCGVCAFVITYRFIIIIIIINIIFFLSGYLQLYAWKNTCSYSISCCNCSELTVYGTCNYNYHLFLCFYFLIFLCTNRIFLLFIIFYLYQQMHIYIYMKILNYFKNSLYLSW